MKAIVAVDSHWGIGAQGGLLVHIPEDLKRFRRLTSGHPVVMGHGTFRSLPGGKPLPNRENMVLSRNDALRIEGVTVLHSLPQLFAHIAGREDALFVIGGEAVYRQLLPYCDTAYVTHVEGPGIPAADVFFPDLLDAALARDLGWQWKVTEEEGPHLFQSLTYTYRTYQNQRVRPLRLP